MQNGVAAGAARMAVNSDDVILHSDTNIHNLSLLLHLFIACNWCEGLGSECSRCAGDGIIVPKSNDGRPSIL